LQELQINPNVTHQGLSFKDNSDKNFPSKQNVVQG